MTRTFMTLDAIWLMQNRGTSMDCICRVKKTGEEFLAQIVYPEEGSGFVNDFVITWKDKSGGYSMTTYNPDIYEVCIKE